MTRRLIWMLIGILCIPQQPHKLFGPAGTAGVDPPTCKDNNEKRH